jgi:putative transposase
MSGYIRNRELGGTYFFTVNLLERGRNDLLVRNIDSLRNAVSLTRTERPFEIIAWVVLPEHMHAIWKLPDGDADYSTRWAAIKARFSQTIQNDEFQNASRRSHGERGIWQRRYWEHTIRDDRDLQNHIDYLHYNPKKHELVDRVCD